MYAEGDGLDYCLNPKCGAILEWCRSLSPSFSF